MNELSSDKNCWLQQINKKNNYIKIVENYIIFSNILGDFGITNIDWNDQVLHKFKSCLSNLIQSII